MFKQKRYILFMICFIACVAFVNQPIVSVNAQQAEAPDAKTDFLRGLYDKERSVLKSPDGKTDDTISNTDEFMERTRIFHSIPYNDPHLEFEIRLPKTWTQVPMNLEQGMELSRRLLGDIARFIGPIIIGNTRPQVSIQAMKLDKGMAAEFWLKNYLLNNGYTQQGDIVVDENTGNIKAAYVYLKNNIAYHAYTKLMLHGDMIVLATFEMPLNLQEEFDFLQKATINNLTFLASLPAGVGDTKSFSVMDAFKFDYPQTWNVSNPDFKDPDRLSIELHHRDVGNTLHGLIRMLAVRREDNINLAGELSRTINALNNYNRVYVQELLSSESVSSHPRFGFSRMETYNATFNATERGSNQELWFVTLGDQDWYIFMYLVTPRPQEDLIHWAENTQAFKSLLESIK